MAYCPKKNNGTIGFAHEYTRYNHSSNNIGRDFKHFIQVHTGDAQYLPNPYLQWLISNNQYVADKDQASSNSDLFSRLKYVKSYNNKPLVESGYGHGFNTKASSSYDYYIDPLTGKYYVKSTPSNFFKNTYGVRTLYDQNLFNDIWEGYEAYDASYFDFVVGNKKYPDGTIEYSSGTGLRSFDPKDLEYWDKYRNSTGGWMQVKEFKPFSRNTLYGNEWGVNPYTPKGLSSLQMIK